MTNEHLDELIAAWLDGRLDTEGSKQLQQELRDSSVARSKFREYAHIDVALHELADTSGMLGPTQLIANAQAILPPTTYDDKGSTVFQRIAFWFAAIAVAALVAVSIYGYYSSGERRVAQLEPAKKMESAEIANRTAQRKPPAPVATLALAEQAVWEKEQLRVGQTLYEGESIRLREGEARISVGFGAEIVAEAPCSLTFLASDRVELHEGKVAVDVAPWAKGFTVVTEEMDIVDLGTTFTVSTSPGVKSETTVLKGVVRVHPSKMQNKLHRGLLVTEGQQVSVDDKGLLKNAKQPKTKQLLGNLDFGPTGPYRPVKLMNTGLGLAAGDEDQHWRVVAGPEGNFSGPQFASVCVPHEQYLPNYPETSQWISIAGWQTAAANSIYTFRAEFELDGYDLSTMQLFGRFLADNGIAAVRVNDEPVQVQSWVDNVKYQPFGDPQFRFVNITDGLVQGQNVIEVDVRNGMMRKGKNPPWNPIPNPMALRVEWYAFGRQHVLARPNDGVDLSRGSLDRGISDNGFPAMDFEW